ncbi:DNA-binding protein HU [compost metagenome]
MNKQEAIKAIAGKTGLTQVDVTKVLNGLEEVTYETLAKGERLQLTGYVTFKPAARAARKGYDPINKQPMDIPSTVGVSTKAGEKLKKSVEGLKYEDFVAAE